MSVIDKIQINSTTYDVAADASNVAYSDAATYPDGSAGKEISQLKSEIANTNEILGNSETSKVVVAGYDDKNTLGASMGYAPFVLEVDPPMVSHGYQVVTAVKMNALRVGVLSIGVIKKAPVVALDSVDLSDAVVKATINLTQTGTQTVVLDSPFPVGQDEYVFVGLPTDTAIFYYGSDGDLGFYRQNNGHWYYDPNHSLGFDVQVNIHAEPEVDFPTVINDVNDIHAVIQKTNVVPYDSYAQDAATYGTFGTAPYIMDKNVQYAYAVTAFKMEVRIAGTVTIGKIKREYASAGVPYDPTKLQIHETLVTHETGTKTFQLSNPMYVAKDEYVFYGISSDTAGHYYDGAGLDRGFLYVNLTAGNYARSNSSMNVTVYGYCVDFAPEIGTYYGKSISILGDSISTYAGYIPEGNATYYPSGTVQSVTDTWWYKLYTALGMTLNVNNSWSGSRVTTTGGDESAGCMTRCQNLGSNPNVIIVWMGINDFNNEVAIGTYDGTTALPETTTTFREAYAIMLNKILTAYPSAEVWVCTLPQCERNGESGFPEINGNGVALLAFNKAILELADAFGVKVLDHNKCGLTYQNMPTFNPDNLHPNKFGHSLVANNDIRQMDNLVRMRYPIS